MKITEQVWQFAEPVVQAHGCTLWDVEYVREGGEWFLRLYLDKEGGVNITDCENVSRAMDPILDEKDPIAESEQFVNRNSSHLQGSQQCGDLLIGKFTFCYTNKNILGLFPCQFLMI